MKKTSAHKIKVVLIFFLLFVESTALSIALINYAFSGDFFTSSLYIYIKIALLMLLISYTYALTVGLCGGWEQYVVAPVSISGGIFIALSLINPMHAKNIALLCALFLLYYSLRTVSTKTLFIKFEPRLILRRATKGILFIFSLTCASVILMNQNSQNQLNIGERVSSIVADQMDKVAQKDLNLKTFLKTTNLDMTLKNQIQDQINKAVEPYKSVLAPVISILVFSIIQAIGAVVFILFSLTINWFFWVARKLKIFRLEYKTVQQETLTF